MQEYDSYTDISVTRVRPSSVQLVWYERALRCASIYLGWQGRLNQWAHWARAQGPVFFLFEGPTTSCGEIIFLTNYLTFAKINTHTHPFNGRFPGLPRWAGTRKVKPIWILLKQETVSASGISWAICKSAPRSRQITTPAPHHSVFTGRMPFLPLNQQRQSTEGNSQISTVRETR